MRDEFRCSKRDALSGGMGMEESWGAEYPAPFAAIYSCRNVFMGFSMDALTAW